jgi:hypothetical protein
MSDGTIRPRRHKLAGRKTLSAKSGAELISDDELERAYLAAQDSVKAEKRELTPTVRWVNPMLRLSVLQWARRGTSQFILALPNREELVLRFENSEWYARGQIEGRDIPPRLFSNVREAIKYFQSQMKRSGGRLMEQLRQEACWTRPDATPLQVMLLKSFRCSTAGVSKEAAMKVITRCIEDGGKR